MIPTIRPALDAVWNNTYSAVKEPEMTALAEPKRVFSTKDPFDLMIDLDTLV
jgi:hypothetical protein